MIAVAVLAFQALDTATPGHVPTSVLIVSTVFSGVSLLITAAGAVWIQKGQKAARSAEARIGEPNGQGDLVRMIVTTQQMVADIGERLTNHELAAGRRFEGMHQALRTERARVNSLEDRPTVIEDRR